MYVDQTFSESMRRLRKAQNLSLDALQKRTGIPLARLREVDAGARAPYLREALLLSDALGTTVDALARGTVAVRMTGVYRGAAQSLPANNNPSEGESENQ